MAKNKFGPVSSIERVSIVYDGSWKMEIKFFNTTTMLPLMAHEGDTVRGRMQAQEEAEQWLNKHYKDKWREIGGN